ncbi:MAG: hypothetical protein ABI647_11980 [Gemmatimonadota bacterium]
MTEAVAHALVFSGRRDPSWMIDEAIGTELVRIWEGLDPVPIAASLIDQLGYRGVVVDGLAGARFLATGGTVTETRAGARRTRADPERRFERRVLDAGPPGLIDRASRPE